MHGAFCFHFTAVRRRSSMASVPVFCRDFWAEHKNPGGRDDLECAPLIGLRHPASASCLGRHLRLAGRCPNNSSLFPPLAAVVVVALCALSSGRIILNLRRWKICGFSSVAFSRGGVVKANTAKKPRRAGALRGGVQILKGCAYSLTIKRIRVYLSCLVTVTPNLAGFSTPASFKIF